MKNRKPLSSVMAAVAGIPIGAFAGLFSGSALLPLS